MNPSYKGLSKALESSIDQATDFTRALFGDQLWTADRLATFINSVRGITVCTTGPKGRPHAAFVIAHCDLDRIFFTATNGSVLLRNLRGSPYVAFSLTRDGQAVVGSGKAVRTLADHGLRTTPGDYDVHPPTELAPPEWNGEVYWINIYRIFAS